MPHQVGCSSYHTITSDQYLPLPHKLVNLTFDLELSKVTLTCDLGLLEVTLNDFDL